MAVSTASLWSRYASTRSGTDLSSIEVELARRGQTHSGSSYIGQRGVGAVGTRSFRRDGTRARSSDLFNCGDFATALDAQRRFLASGGPSSDPHDLDRDGDGFACEWGTERTRLSQVGRSRIAASARVVRARTAPRRSVTTSGRCHIGPRGGTYTITASGRKNYGGC